VGIDRVACSLCESPTQFFSEFRNVEYLICSNCQGIQVNPKSHITQDEEKDRYLTHNNDVKDLRYQQFVSPIVNAVLNQFNSKQKGLDFGAGTGPVITELLKEKGYEMALYDPYFWNDQKVLKEKYDFIVICEVIEHFYTPDKEFKLLRSLLKENGSIFIMTDLYHDEINFDKWYYKNDPTHVFFYQQSTINWIKNHYDFKRVSIVNRLIQLSV